MADPLIMMGDAMKRVALTQAENLTHMRFEPITIVALCLCAMAVLFMSLNSVMGSSRRVWWSR